MKVNKSSVEVRPLKIPINDIVVNARLYLPNQNQKSLPLIFFNHGWSMTFKFPQLTQWGYGIAGTGKYACLIYECRGHGKTTGKKELGTIFKDIPKIIDYGATIPEIDPNRLGFAGISMGGEIALTRAYENPRIKATVAMCSPHNAISNFGRKPRSLKERLVLAYLHFSGVDPKKISEETNRFISPEFVFPNLPESYREKAFIIHAKDDMVVAFEQGLQNIELMKLSDSQTMIFEKAGHTFLGQESKILEKMLAFFEQKI